MGCIPDMQGWISIRKNIWSCYRCRTGILFYFLLNFLFCIGIELISNAVIVSGEQQSNSAINRHVSILPQTLSYPGFHITLSSFMCYTVGPYWLSIWNVVVCPCPSQISYLSPPSLPATITSFSSLWVCFCFVNEFVSYIFRFCI